jgi:hypothetical protein
MEGDSRNRLQGGGQGGVWVQEELTVSVLVRPGGYRCESHCRRSRPRSARTAPERNSHLGWAEIRHPFHPLRGQRFQVLKARRIAGIDTLLIRELDRGSFSIAREWTDWADPSPYCLLGLAPRRLDAALLFELATLLEQLTSPEQKG